MDYVNMSIGVRSSRTTVPEENHTQSVYILPMTIDTNGINDSQSMFNLLFQVWAEAEKVIKQALRIRAPDHINYEYLRKYAEFALEALEYKILYCTNNERSSERRSSERKRTVGSEKIIIKAPQGKSYADLLKSVKSSVNIVEKGIQIKSMRKTNKGDLMMDVKEVDKCSWI